MGTRHLISELTHEGLLWRDGQDLDQEELCIVFRLIDADKSGFLTADEIVVVFKQQGLCFQSEEEWGIFRLCMIDGCKAAGSDQGFVDLDGFRTHLKEFFGGRLVRKMAHQKSSLGVGAALEAVEGEALA